MTTKARKKFLSFPSFTLLAGAVAFAIISACTSQSAKAKINMIFKPAPKSGVVAKIGNDEIDEDTLIGDAKLDFFELKKQEYDRKLDRLNKLVIDKLVGAEAKTAGMSQEDYINKKILGGEVKISDKEFNKFVDEKKIPKDKINPQIKERIMQYMQSGKKQELLDAHVAKLTKNNPVEVYFTKPKLTVNVEVGNAPIWGKADAPVTIVEFSDFQCPYCSQAAKTLEEVKKKYAGKVKVAFKNFPLPATMHPDAQAGAEAGACVAEQGADKFWKFHDITFKNQKSLDTASLEKYAKEAGADTAKYGECVKAKKYVDLVNKDKEYGDKLGVKSTPTFFVNGQFIAGSLPIESFSEIIDEELGKK